MLEKSKGHLVLIGFGTALSIFSLGSIITFTDPFTSGIGTHFFFYISLFMSFFGLFSLLGLLLRQKLTTGLYINHMAVSVRQALFGSVFICSLFLLKANDLLYWWIALTLALFLFSLEFFLNLK
jgi:hypothetical protein